MIFTTSYKSEGMEELLTALVKTVGAKTAIEFGTQQGHSAILLAKGGARVKTYDLFEEKYNAEPFKETHANLLKALKNTEKYNIQVYQKDVNKVKPVKCDVLHIDICNHRDNVYPLLENWQSKVKKMIILEGGVYNKWQKKYKFETYLPALDVEIMSKWHFLTIKGENGYAITILTRI